MTSAPRLWARCVHGLEHVVSEEIAERLRAAARVIGHRDVELVSDDLLGALGLRTVDDVYLVAGEVAGVGRARVDLRRLARDVHDLPVRAIAERRRSVIGARPTHIGVTASFLGRRNFSRFDVEDAAGSELGRVLGLPYLSRRAGVPGRAPGPGGLEWRVHIAEGRARVGLRIAEAPLHRRLYKREAPPGTTHPPVAAAMVRLARTPAGTMLWDPTCGAGTIPIEARILSTEIEAGGSEIDVAMAHAARRNVVTARVECPIVVADAARLPLRAGSVGALVANLPWGRQAASLGGLDGVGHLLRIADAVVESRGSVTVLAEERGLPRSPSFELVEELPLALMGARPMLRVWRRR